MQLRCYKELLFCRELRELRMSLSTGLRALVFVLLSRGSLGAISLRPSNAVAELNGQAVFYSEANGFRGAWYFSQTGILSDEIAIVIPPCAANTGYGAHYGTNTTGGTNACNLIVANITMAQAGVYRYAEQDSFSALLIVTDSSPAITANSTTSVVESQSVLIQCVLNYNGSIPPAPTLRPYFNWTDSDGQTVSSSRNSTTENTAVSQLTVTAGRQDITPYTCHVYFELSPMTTTGYSNSTPTVNSNANSPIIKVSYGPSKPEVVKIGSEVITLNGVPCGINILNCSSTGNPTPNYTWYDSADSNTVLSTNNTLTLGEINRNYICEAQNAIGISPTTYPVAKADCFTTVGCCVYPRNETTSVNVEGCLNNKTQCDCSKGTSGIKLICNATSFPNASYMWSGPGVQPTDSPVYDAVFYSGTYWCTAYFNRSLSNYTGDVSFSNGTNQTSVGECCDIYVLVAAFLVPYFGCNVISLVVFLIVYCKLGDFKNNMDGLFEDTGNAVLIFVLFVGVFVCFVIPGVVTIAYCYNRGKGTWTWFIFVIWSVHVAFLFPTAFIVVYFVHCKQMTFEIS